MGGNMDNALSRPSGTPYSNRCFNAPVSLYDFFSTQAKATGKTSSGRMTYQESMAAEKNKQKDLKMSNERRRATMCEELGRGC
ncbi:unnamed protein product [Choristocarpus tenellus]